MSPCPDCVDTRVCHICGGQGSSAASGIPTACRACAGTGICASCGGSANGTAGTTGTTGKAFPRQREGALTAAESGTVGSSPLIHAVVKTLTGNKARCGAGGIGALVTGRFEPNTDGRCPDCSQP